MDGVGHHLSALPLHPHGEVDYRGMHTYIDMQKAKMSARV